MTARRAGASAVALTVLAVGVMLLMVMFAARSGPTRVFTGPLHDPDFGGVTPSISVPPRPSSNGIPHRADLHSTPFFQAIGWAVKGLVLVCVLWLLYLACRRLVRYLAERTPLGEDQARALIGEDDRLHFSG